MSQYPDDTTLILDGSKTSLSTSLKVLEYFSKISEFRLIILTKKEALWIGAKPVSLLKRLPEMGEATAENTTPFADSHSIRTINPKESAIFLTGENNALISIEQLLTYYNNYT